MIITNELKTKINILLDKVEEVLRNNDWPTEEGCRQEGKECYIEHLINDIRVAIQK